MHNKIDANVVILAGGKSSRMGIKEDKALLKIAGFHLIEKISGELRPYFHEIIISAGAESLQNYAFLPYRKAIDHQVGQGPLMGILSGLRVSGRAINFVIACDIPEIDFPFIREMAEFTGDYDIVVPFTGNEKYEPLFAFYHKGLIPKIEELLSGGTRKIIELFSHCRVKYVPMDGKDWYYNLNTPDDYEQYLNRYKKKNTL
jgi:molybdopterin-guanine dinucleotide biosynthesis protein A